MHETCYENNELHDFRLKTYSSKRIEAKCRLAAQQRALAVLQAAHVRARDAQARVGALERRLDRGRPLTDRVRAVVRAGTKEVLPVAVLEKPTSTQRSGMCARTSI